MGEDREVVELTRQVKKRGSRGMAKGLRREYDFRRGVRGKYVARMRRGSNVVVLDDDVAARFPTSDAVNRALRALLQAVPARRRAGRRNTKSAIR